MTRTTQDNQAEGASFAVFQRELEDGPVIVAEGDLDLAAAPSLKWALMELRDAGVTNIVLDMANVSFIDSTAIGVLVGAQRGLPPGSRLTIAAPVQEVLSVFELTGLDATFDIVPTLDEARSRAASGGAAAG